MEILNVAGGAFRWHKSQTCAMWGTFQKLIKNKKDRNLDIVISKDGKVVRINPNDLIL
jgi:hypothetical protein